MPIRRRPEAARGLASGTLARSQWIFVAEKYVRIGSPVRALHLRLEAAGDERAALGVGARVLPDDRGRDRDPGARVPEDDRLALVRHAEREHGLAGPGGDRFGDDAVDVVANLESVVLDPAGMGEGLRVLAVCGGDHAPGQIEQEAARSGRSLVDRREERHRTKAISSPLSARRRAGAE